MKKMFTDFPHRHFSSDEEMLPHEQIPLQCILNDTLLAKEHTVDPSIYSVAPGENQRPIPLLTDNLFEELAFQPNFLMGRVASLRKDR